jgi:hypothetical protein
MRRRFGKTVAYIRNSYFHAFGGNGENMAYLNGRHATLYCYNNVFVKPISAQGAIEIEPYDYGANQTSGTYYVLNNTGSVDAGDFIRVVDRGGSPKPLLIVARNNHVIGTSVSLIGGGPAGTQTTSNSLIQTLAVANGQGYNAANVFSPDGAGDSTVDAGFDVSSILTSVGGNIDRLGVARPQNSTWDIGAYEFVSGGGGTSGGGGGSSSSLTIGGNIVIGGKH